MEIYVVSHGLYEDYHVSLVTTDFELAIEHFLGYSKISRWSPMRNIDVWIGNKRVFSYGSMNYDIINNREKEELTYEEIRNDFLRQWVEKFNKIYVDKLPKTCWNCSYFGNFDKNNKTYKGCILTKDIFSMCIRPPCRFDSCPLVLAEQEMSFVKNGGTERFLSDKDKEIEHFELKFNEGRLIVVVEINGELYKKDVTEFF